MASSVFRPALCVAFILLFASAANAAAPSEVERRRAFKKEMKTSTIVPKDAANAKQAEDKVIQLQNKVIEQGCNLNACFGIDGSNEIAPEDFRKQAQFVAAVASIAGLDPEFHAAAFQYGLKLRQISGLTKDISKFILDVAGTKFEPASGSFLAPVIIHCGIQLKRRFVEDANQIVLIGDGRSDIFAQDFSVRQAEKFLPPYNNGAIAAVTVRRPNNKFWDRITQNPERVIDIDDYDKFFLILEDVVNDVCNLV